MQNKMVAKSDKIRAQYYRNNALESVVGGEIEVSGSSGRIDMDITGSEDSSVPTRKCINFNANKQDTFGVPIQILSLSRMTGLERRDLVRRLRLDLEQMLILQKRVEVLRVNGVTVSSSSDILSCSNGTNRPQLETFKKSSTVMGKKGNPIAQVRVWNRGSSGRFQSAKQASTGSTANMVLMKQCETLLKRLMSHQYGWVFNSRVDVVKLNLPDYLTIIKHPMDLGTVKKKLSAGAYTSPLDFAADVKLTFKNAMEYNPKGHDVYIMADTLGKFFETRWKPIEKKLPRTNFQPLPEESGPRVDFQGADVSPAKKRKITSFKNEIMQEPIKQAMTDEEKHNLGRELESLLGEMPGHIIDFLREHCSNGKDDGLDEIEIDIDDLSVDTLFTLRKLLDDYLQEKQKNQGSGEPCEIEMLNEPGLSNSSLHENKDSEFGSSSGSESDIANGSSPANASKVPVALGSGAQLADKTSAGSQMEMNQSVSGLDQLERTSQQKTSSVESHSRQDVGESAPSDSQVSPEKAYRYAMLKNRYADTILKAKEKTLSRDDNGDPEKLRREREELELLKQKEKARLRAEAKAAEDARKKAEAVAAAEAKKKRELQREAARQALLQMEKTVEINENSQFLEDLEMLRSAPAEHLLSSVDEISPDPSQDGLGGFTFGACNPLEQLGLFMKDEEEEEEGDPSNLSNPENEVEEGEID